MIGTTTRVKKVAKVKKANIKKKSKQKAKEKKNIKKTPKKKAVKKVTKVKKEVKRRSTKAKEKKKVTKVKVQSKPTSKKIRKSNKKEVKKKVAKKVKKAKETSKKSKDKSGLAKPTKKAKETPAATQPKTRSSRSAHFLKEKRSIKTHEVPNPLKSKEKLDRIYVCPECGSTNLIRDYERGEIICKDCGLVISENLEDYGPEWRSFDAEQRAKRARGGSPTTYMRPNKGLVTEIDQYNRDIRGSKIDVKHRAELHRMRKWHKRVSIATSFEKNLSIALAELDRVGSSLGLPDNVKEAAAMMYRKAVKQELIRGRLIESVVAATIYAICRQYGIPRTLDEISRASGIEKKEIGRAYRFLKKEMSLNIPLTDPSTYVPKFAAALNLSPKVQEEAVNIIKKALKKGLISGRGPTGVAAAAIYIAAAEHGERKTQKEVADVAGVTEVTIRNRYRELKKELNLKVNI